MRITKSHVTGKSFIGRVIPLYKSGNQALVSNYRPITLLSVFHKIMEKLMFNRLVNFLDKHNMLDDNQFDFRSGCSTAQASMLITDKIQRAIGNKLYSCAIFLDLSKAFDTVDRLFTVPYIFVRSFRYTASYRHVYCTEGAGVGDYSSAEGGGARKIEGL